MFEDGVWAPYLALFHVRRLASSVLDLASSPSNPNTDRNAADRQTHVLGGNEACSSARG